MAESTNALTIVLEQMDSSSVDIIRRTIGAVSYAGSVGEFLKGTLTTTGATSLTLPTTNVLHTYVKNTHATAVITIIATVQGGSTQTVSKCQPGGVFVNWCASSGATAGYTAISLTSDTVGGTFELFIGG